MPKRTYPLGQLGITTALGVPPRTKKETRRHGDSQLLETTVECILFRTSRGTMSTDNVRFSHHGDEYTITLYTVPMLAERLVTKQCP